MPEVRASQLQGKTLTLKKAIPFYRVNDINNLGNKSKPVSNLPIGYKLKVDTFLLKGPAYTDSYGLLKAKRSDDYFTFFGKDGKYYAIKVASIVVGKEGLKEAGIKTVKQEEQEAAQAEQSTVDKIFSSFGKFANFAKYLTIGIAAVWATGYLIKSTKK